jgi:hypothetical protein
VLEVAMVAAAAELLCLAGEYVDGAMLLNGNGKFSLAAICKHKDYASRARSSAAIKAALLTDLSDFKRSIETQYNTNDKPCCAAAARKAIGNGLWTCLCLLAAAVGATGVMTELYFKGEATFVAEAGDKARVWWNRGMNSEAAKMKSAWLEAAKKRGALPRGAPPERPRRSVCLLSLPLCKPLALTVVLKTAVSRSSEAPRERDLTERRKCILQHREQRTGARVFFVTGLPPPPSS